MLHKCILFLYIIGAVYCQNNVKLHLREKLHTTFLEQYAQYADVVLFYFNIGEDISFSAFKFQAEEIRMSLFLCSPQNVSVYLKQGAPPVINPDGSRFPKGILNSSLSDIFAIDFTSDKTPHYINITSPLPGHYYGVAFKSWTNPLQSGITQQGLTPQCFTFVDAELHTAEETVEILVPNTSFDITINGSKTVKYYVPNFANYFVLSVQRLELSNMKPLQIRIRSLRIPAITDNITFNLSAANVPFTSQMLLQFPGWNYIKYRTIDAKATINIKVMLYSSINSTAKMNSNDPILKTYTNGSTDLFFYNEYQLVRQSSSENFLYSFHLQPINESAKLEVNVTDTQFAAVKFSLNDFADFGGTLQVNVAFKPSIKVMAKDVFVKNNSGGKTVIVCIHRHFLGIPSWPNVCVHGDKKTTAPFILNDTVANDTALIPFPEAGDWYVTMRAFNSQSPESCSCPDECRNSFDVCVQTCVQDCKTATYCDNCLLFCEKITLKGQCWNCSLSNCFTNVEDQNVSLIFDISSQPCVQGECGEQGNCMFLVSQGILFSACSCFSNFRGWNCTDDTYANSFFIIILSLLLLVLSNLFFIPSVYFAYKRKYYVEAVVYASICFFSTFYHACDAGEGVISFCITKISVLQFADFFCALLAIWVTLIAIAHLPTFWPAVSHMVGSIFIAFGTTLDRLSLWIFLVPSSVGIVIILLRWYLFYRRYKTLNINKKYLYVRLPVGLGIVALGLIIYTAFQTLANYQYTHSIWHVIMAVSIMLVLPSRNTFISEQQI